MFYESILNEAIREEKKGLEYVCSKQDRMVLKKMLQEINRYCGTHFHYMAEIDMLSIEGSGEIMLKYINCFESELFRSCLISQLVTDKVENCSVVVMGLYKHFRMSNDYPINTKNLPRINLQITGSYDNAFKKLKPKSLQNEFLYIFSCPLDVLYLGLTFKVVSSWKMPKMEILIKKYIDADILTKYDFGIFENFENMEEFLKFIKKQVKLHGLSCLCYYPTNENKKIMERYLEDSDRDV